MFRLIPVLLLFMCNAAIAQKFDKQSFLLDRLSRLESKTSTNTAAKYNSLSRILNSQKDATEYYQRDIEYRDNWDRDSSVWKLRTGRREYSYDNNHNLSNIIAYEWDDDEQDWQLDIRSTLEYNNDNNLTYIFAEKWVDGDWQKWVEEYTFYNDENLITSVESVVSVDDIEFTDRVEYLYENGLEIGWIYSFRESDNQEWQEVQRTDSYIYDQENRLLEYKRYNKGALVEDWNLWLRVNNTYNTQGNLENVTEFNFFSNSLSSKEEYVYDENQNQTSVHYFSFNRNIQDWIENERYNYEYSRFFWLDQQLENIEATDVGQIEVDLSTAFRYVGNGELNFETEINQTDLLSVEIEEDKLLVSIMDTENTVDTIDVTASIGKFQLSQRIPVRLNKITSVEDNILSEKIYPNPTSGTLKLELNTFNEPILWSIMSLKGDQINQGYLVGNSIDVSALNSGMYILNIRVNNNLMTERIVIEN